VTGLEARATVPFGQRFPWHQWITIAVVVAVLGTIIPPSLFPLGFGLLAAAVALAARRDGFTASRAAATIALLALIGRILTAILIRGYDILPEHYTSDAMGFEFDALAQLTGWKESGLVAVYLLERNRPDSIAYRNLLALFALLPLWPVGWIWLGNILLSTVGAWLTGSALLRFGKMTRGALMLAAIGALVPSALVFGAMPVRDNAILAAVGLYLYGLAATERPGWIRFGCVAMGILVCTALRIHFGACLAVGLGGVYTWQFVWRRMRRVFSPLSSIIATVLLAVLGVVVLGAVALALARTQVAFVSVTPELLALVRKAQSGTIAGGATSGSGYLLDVSLNNWAEVALFGVVAGLLFLVGPPFGIGAGSGGFLVGLEGLFWLGLLTWSLASLRGAKKPNAAYWILVILFMGLGLFGIITADYGTAARQRLQFIPFILALSALAFAAGSASRLRIVNWLRQPLSNASSS
jgi:hypothetical protein